MDRVLPAGDHEPGASAANAIGYLRWLAAQPEFGESWPLMRLGVDMLDHIARVAHDRGFADCDAAQRDMVLLRLVEVPHPGTQKFLVLLIRATLAGFLCPPSFGGNAGGVGWTSIGFAPQSAACPTGGAV
jgi:hypothetical protein